MLQEVLQIVAQALFFAVPAYATNAFPPMLRGKRPLDRGCLWRGQRLFGDGKTIEGTFGGIMLGIAIGILQIFVRGSLPEGIAEWYSLPVMTLPLVILICIGAMSGDIIGSFIKRRFNISQGDSAPVMDQIGFIVMAMIFAAPLYMLPAASMAFLIIVTIILHWLANQIGYVAKLKRVPW